MSAKPPRHKSQDIFPFDHDLFSQSCIKLTTNKNFELNSTKPHVKTLLKYLLVEMGGFKFQITSKVLFLKEIENGGTKLSPLIYF